MKKKHLRASWRLIAAIAISTVMVPVWAQVPINPSAWSDFLKDKQKIIGYIQSKVEQSYQKRIML